MFASPNPWGGWTWKEVVLKHNHPVWKPFPWKLYTSKPTPYNSSEFLLAASQYHVVKQGLFLGLPLILVFMVELCMLNLVSLPFDNELQTFGYEVHYNNVWVAQLFDELYDDFEYGVDVTERSHSAKKPKGHKDIFIEKMSTRMHDSLPKSLAEVSAIIDELVLHRFITPHTENSLRTQVSEIAGLMSHFLSPTVKDSEGEQLLRSVSEEIRESTELHLHPHEKDYGRAWVYKQAEPVPISNVLDREPGTVLQYMYEIEQKTTKLMTTLRRILYREGDYMSSVESLVFDASFSLSRLQHTQFLFARAIQNYTAGTLALSQTHDVLQAFMLSYVQDPETGELIKFYDERPWFDFGWSLNAFFLLCAYYWFTTERMPLPTLKGVRPAPFRPETKNSPGVLKWKIRTIKPLAVMLIHYAVTLGLLRILRFLTYGGTLLPPNRVWCKPSRFNNNFAKYGFPEQLTHSTPFWQRIGTIVSFVLQTYGSKTGGACNDLIYSGHVTMYVLTIILYHYYSPHWFFTILVYVIGVEATLHSIVKGHHYTVDCFVAIYVTFLMQYFVRTKILPFFFGKELVKQTQLIANPSKKKLSKKKTDEQVDPDTSI